ncbi:aldehyde dehydrogenase (NADP(+)) [Paractinoplanes rishiriensis]|uniref:Aldehyde dehydrogenase n=1 Tax=Paractinoplanes rishiriensis TaxID=1050105 RepID=A0A919MTC2_9ACTN|nr:aldehyde dehydrogenase (NADP(+)) [Actinoplanes rishiriensis]GIE94104.1 aldehyde dehydrogenase [Actinoplanes rishiriensis]
MTDVASTDVVSIDPRTGEVTGTVAAETGTGQVDAACRQAAAAAGALDEFGRLGRAALLDALAAALDGGRDRIVATAGRESGLGTGRLDGELTRTCYQLRFFGEVLRDGGYLEAIVDHAGDTPMGPRPDLRRMLVPVGPVAVFGASNFPLAFSVPGGDTASALAAGCPVVVKAHGSHPATAQLCFDLMDAAARRSGAPEGTLALVHGVPAGADLVAHPAIRAVGFTGSLGGGRALLEIIERRPEPIPFFGELSSLNPVIVTPDAAAERAADIGAGVAGSVLLGAGQFCTKPGLVFVPAGAAGDAVVAAIAEAVGAAEPQVMLNGGIAESFARISAALAARTETVTHGAEAAPATGGEAAARATGPAGAGGFFGRPLLLATTAAGLPPEATEECFGPVTVVARYRDEADLVGALGRLPGSLTATVQHASGETRLPAELSRRLLPRAGRIIYNGYPTGVAVAWAQQHGGPWPATNSQHTSVGATAIRRFLRPVAWQNCPPTLLPPELADDYRAVPRRVDGVVTPADTAAAVPPAADRRPARPAPDPA